MRAPRSFTLCPAPRSSVVGYLRGESFNLSGSDAPEQVFGARFSADYLELLGVKVALGRSFLPEEDRPGNDRVVILSHRFWKNRFNADRNIVGNSLTLNGKKFTVVGVLARYSRSTPTGRAL